MNTPIDAITAVSGGKRVSLTSLRLPYRLIGPFSTNATPAALGGSRDTRARQIAVTQDISRTTSAEGSAVMKLGDGMLACLRPVLRGTDNCQATAKLWLWSAVMVPAWMRGDGTEQLPQWVRSYLGEISMVAGTLTGLSGGVIEASDRYADTITITEDHAQNSVMRVFGPATPNQEASELQIDTRDAMYMEIHTAIGSGCEAVAVLAREMGGAG